MSPCPPPRFPMHGSSHTLLEQRDAAVATSAERYIFNFIFFLTLEHKNGKSAEALKDSTKKTPKNKVQGEGRQRFLSWSRLTHGHKHLLQLHAGNCTSDIRPLLVWDSGIWLVLKVWSWTFHGGSELGAYSSVCSS